MEGRSQRGDTRVGRSLFRMAQAELERGRRRLAVLGQEVWSVRGGEAGGSEDVGSAGQ